MVVSGWLYLDLKIKPELSCCEATQLKKKISWKKAMAKHLPYAAHKNSQLVSSFTIFIHLFVIFVFYYSPKAQGNKPSYISIFLLLWDRPCYKVYKIVTVIK